VKNKNKKTKKIEFQSNITEDKKNDTENKQQNHLKENKDQDKKSSGIDLKMFDNKKIDDEYEKF
jgi:hypothetical protein